MAGCAAMASSVNKTKLQRAVIICSVCISIERNRRWGVLQFVDRYIIVYRDHGEVLARERQIAAEFSCSVSSHVGFLSIYVTW